jgi:hypothetical protein
MGDSLAEGVWASLFRRFPHSRTLRIVNAATASTGFNRTPYEDRVRDTLRRHPIDLLVIMTGANDAQDAWGLDGGPNARFGTDTWRELYAKRLQRFLDPVYNHRLSTLWIALPVMRNPSFEVRVAQVRGLHRALCAEYFIPHVEPQAATGDDDGAYASHGRDDKGRLRLLRHEDGVHFTEFGYDLMGSLILRHIIERWPAWLAPQVVHLTPPTSRI